MRLLQKNWFAKSLVSHKRLTQIASDLSGRSYATLAYAWTLVKGFFEIDSLCLMANGEVAVAGT